MCYSTLIESNFDNLEMRFDAKMDWDSVIDAFNMRAKYKSVRIPAAIDTYIIQNAKTADQKKLVQLAQAHYQQEIAKLIAKKAKFENDCLEFERKIKSGSKAKDLDLKLEKRRQSVIKLQTQIQHFHQIEDAGSARIFPNFYAPAMIQSKKGLALQLMRYQILPASGVELLPSKYNLFNARRDKLTVSKMWKPLFGRQHAIFPFFRFYENVDDGFGGNKVIYFESEDNELMWSAAIYEESHIKEGLLRSFAAITDEPPPEVAETGHDRCPIFLNEEKIDLWLNPQNLSIQELLQLLDDKMPTFFEHHNAA